MTQPVNLVVKKRVPVVTLVLLLASLGGFLVELNQGPGLGGFFQHYALVPAQFLAFLRGSSGTSFSRSVLPFVTTLFLHTGLAHLIINTWYLWLVGDVLEVFIGSGRFLLLWAAGSLAWGGMVLLTVGTPYSGYPCVGADGAIAAFLGAYLGIYHQILKGSQQFHRRRLLMVGTPIAAAVVVWFPLQVLTRWLALPASTLLTEHGPPWAALAVSFLLGVLLVQLMLPRARNPADAIAVSELPPHVSVQGHPCNLSQEECPESAGRQFPARTKATEAAGPHAEKTWL